MSDLTNTAANKLTPFNRSVGDTFDSNNRRWVEEIQSFLEDEFDDDDLIPVCIFNVPKTISVIKPEAYVPQLLALGPYHHWRENLYEMERYKLHCAKRVQAQFQHFDFNHLIKKLMKVEYRIRACYQKHLDVDGETLAWMMTIDGIFLLEFLCIFINNRGSDLMTGSTRMSYLQSGKKLAYDEVLHDLLKLENQIPIFVLQKIMRVQFSSGEQADNKLPLMLLGVCKELSPLKLRKDYPFPKVMEHAHLLDLLYHLILPRPEVLLCQSRAADCPNDILEDQQNPEELNKGMETLKKTWKLISRLNVGVVRNLKKLLYSKPIKLAFKVPLQVLSKVPVLSVLAPIVGNSLSTGNKEKNDEDDDEDDEESKSPLVEEIMIPSVSELLSVGVTFCPTHGNISTIHFDNKTKQFYLPVLHMDHHTEFVMRNLVAYEASAVSGPLVLGRYTELMNGIIDTVDDAKLLREKKIIKNRLKSDTEVADFWNGMNRNVKLSKVSFIDKAIYDINMFYNNTQKVKFKRMMMAYVYGSWRILILLATMLLLGLMMLQSFCTVYSCPRFFNIEDTDTSSAGTE